MLTLCAPLPAQIQVSGEAGVALLDGGAGPSPRTVNEGRPTFAWRADAFIDAILTESAALIVNIRTFQNEDPTFDFLAVRITDLPVGAYLQVGKFDLPFGNLGERRFAMKNPLYGLPLMYEYATAMPGATATLASASPVDRRSGAGLRMLDFGMYDVGVMAWGEWGMFGWSLAAVNGTVSATANRRLDPNTGFGTIVRATVTPSTGVVIGAAWNRGPWLAGTAPASAPSRVDPDASVQHAVEIDVEYGSGHLVVYGQAMLSRWPVPTGTTGASTLEAGGWYLEATYSLTPRLRIAARTGGLHFLRDGRADRGTWDDEVTEFEGGMSWRLDRAMTLKAAYRHTRTRGGDPPDDLAAMQLAVAF